MSELVVVFVLCACGVIVVAAHARSLVGSTAQRRELDRMLGAVERACSDFLTNETRRLAALLGLVGLALCVPLLLWRWQQPHAGARLSVSALGLLLGGATGAALARLTHWASARATARALAELPADANAASAAVFRGALLLSLAVDAASCLLSCLALLGYQRFASWVLHLDAATALQEATRNVPVVALGAIGAALVFQLGGGGFQAAASVQAAASLRERRVALDEEQNPALVAELVGDHVGGLVSRSSDMFAALMLANAALLALAGAVVGSNPELHERAALALVALPLVVRAIGLLATAIATGSSRLGPGLLPWQAFAGAGVSQALIAATGLLGATFWLLGAPSYLPAFGAGLLGILASLVCQGLLLGLHGAGSLGAPRVVPGTAATSLARALGFGLQRAWAPLLVAGVCLGGAHALGARTNLSDGGAYTLLLAVAGMAGSGALHLSSSAFSSIGSSVRRLGALRRARYDLTARCRAAELERAGLAIGNLGDIQAILCGTAAALLGALTLPLLGVSRLPSPASGVSLSMSSASPALPSMAHPLLILGALLGMASLSCYVGAVLQNHSRAASAANAAGTGEQKEEHGAATSAHSSTQYRGSVVRAAGAATDTLLPLAAAALIAPMVVGIAVRLLYGSEGGRLAGYALLAVAGISVLTGCCAALVARGALMALGRARLVADGKLAGNVVLDDLVLDNLVLDNLVLDSVAVGRSAGSGISPDGVTPEDDAPDRITPDGIARNGGVSKGHGAEVVASAAAVSFAHDAADAARALMGYAVGPAASLGLKATVASALVIVPLLSTPAL